MRTRSGLVCVVGAAWAVLAVFLVVGGLAVLGGCSSWALRDQAAAKKVEAEAARVEAAEGVKDVVAIDRAVEAATAPDGAVDESKLASELAKTVRAMVLADLTEKMAGGASVTSAAADARLAAQARSAQALAALEARLAELRAVDAQIQTAAVKDQRAWDLADWGIGLAGLLGVPGIALVSAHLGKLRGITTGATQAAQVVGTARALDPAIDGAFAATDKAALLRQVMLKVDPRVRRAINDNKSTPLPGADAAVATVLAQAASSGVASFGADEIETMKQRVNEMRAEIALLRSNGSGGGTPAPA